MATAEKREARPKAPGNVRHLVVVQAVEIADPLSHLSPDILEATQRSAVLLGEAQEGLLSPRLGAILFPAFG